MALGGPKPHKDTSCGFTFVCHLSIFLSECKQASSDNKCLSCFSGPTVCTQKRRHETVDQEKTEMDTRPKTAAGGLQGLKRKGSHEINPRKQLKSNMNLDRWLVKLPRNTSSPEECQAQEDVEITDEGGFQSSPSHSLGCDNAEKTAAFDSDEETQPLTPQELVENRPVSPALKDDGDLDKEEVASSSQSTKFTDLSSGTSSSGSSLKRGRPDKSAEKPHTDEETTSDDGDNDDDDEHGNTWRGTPISELRRMPECGGPLPPLKDFPGLHTVMIRV